MGMLSVSSLRLSAPALVDDERGLEVVLVVSPDAGRRADLGDVVDTGGWVSTTVGSMQEAVWELTPVLPQLVVIDVPDPIDSDWALELIDRIRGHDGGEKTPIVLLTPLEHRALTLAAFGRRADDVVAGPAYTPTSSSRDFVSASSARPCPARDLKTDPTTGALSEASFAAQVEHELERLVRGGRPGVLALLQLDELPELEARYGARARDEIMAQVVALIEEDSRDIDFVGHARGVLAILMPATPAKGGQVRLDRLARLLSGTEPDGRRHRSPDSRRSSATPSPSEGSRSTSSRTAPGSR